MKLNMKMNIKTKLIITFMIIGLVPFITIGLITLYKSNVEIQSQAFQKLAAVREIKKSSIERYFNTIRDQAITLSQDTMVIDAMREFKSGFASFRDENNLSDEKIKSLRTELANITPVNSPRNMQSRMMARQRM